MTSSTSSPPPSRGLLLQILAISAAVSLGFWLWEARLGLNLWDEGFFWYGVQQVLRGDVPLRDFQAYEPARYYWSAAWMALGRGGDGPLDMVSLRGTNALLHFAGLALALWTLSLGVRRQGIAALLAVVAVALSLWMIPHFKMADLLASILLVAALAALLDAPTPKRHLIAGIGIGFAAVLGRNHGIYGLAGAALALAWLHLPRHAPARPGLWRGALWMAPGVAIGFLPMVAMCLFVPGFAAAFWESIRFLFELRATNIPLPVPWPWRVELAAPLPALVRDLSLGLWFVAAPIAALLALAAVFLRRWRGAPVPAALAACAFLALPYIHYAFSRADYHHLAFGIFPVLIGAFALSLGAPRAMWRAATATALLAASIVTMLGYHPGWQCRAEADCVEAKAGAGSLRIDKATAAELDMIERITRQYAPEGRAFMVAPLWPGAYPLLSRRAPTWEIYSLFRRTPAFEQSELARLRAASPGFALVYDHALDGDEQARFRHTHPLTQAYLAREFVLVPHPARPELQLYVSPGNPGLAHPPEFLRMSASELATLGDAFARVQVVRWGPDVTPAGTIPNAQPDGSAGIWIQVSGDAGIGDVRVLVDGTPATSTGIAPGSVTAAVPAALFAAPGERRVAIEQIATGRRLEVGTMRVSGRTP